MKKLLLINAHNCGISLISQAGLAQRSLCGESHQKLPFERDRVLGEKIVCYASSG